MKKTICGFAVFIIVFSFSSCISFGTTYYTYELEGAPSRYSVTNITGRYNIHQRWYIFVDDTDAFFSFHLGLEGADMGARNTEPYNLEMSLPSRNTDRIIFNEMFFQSGNKSIKKKKKVAIRFIGERNREQLEGESRRDYEEHLFEEEDLINFRNSGIIDLSKYSDEWRTIKQVRIHYNNVDVIYKNDPYFHIKYDFTFEGDYKTQDYNFTLNFIRKEFREWTRWILTA
jgi:hypothetical protein